MTVATLIAASPQGRNLTALGSTRPTSPSIGGWIAQSVGYGPMVLTLGNLSLGPVALWLGFASVLKPACVYKPDETRDPSAAAVRAPA